jgi:hypothetical protein
MLRALLTAKAVKAATFAEAALLGKRARPTQLAAAVSLIAVKQRVAAPHDGIRYLAALARGLTNLSRRRASVLADAAEADLISRTAAPALRCGRPGCLRPGGITDQARVVRGRLIDGVARTIDQAFAEEELVLTAEVDVTPCLGAAQPIIAGDDVAQAETAPAGAVSDAGAAIVAARAVGNLVEATGTVAQADPPHARRARRRRTGVFGHAAPAVAT